VAQHLRQLGGAELTRSTRAVRQRRQPDARPLVARGVGQSDLLDAPDPRPRRTGRSREPEVVMADGRIRRVRLARYSRAAGAARGPVERPLAP
jgi:hypothetical protein